MERVGDRAVVASEVDITYCDQYIVFILIYDCVYQVTEMKHNSGINLFQTQKKCENSNLIIPSLFLLLFFVSLLLFSCASLGVSHVCPASKVSLVFYKKKNKG